MIIFDSLVLDLVFVICLLFGYVYHHFTKTANHWKNKGVPHLPPTPFLGNNGDAILFRTTLGQNMQKLYNCFPNERFIGIFQSRKPILMLRDPDLIKQILVKDFNNFRNRGIPQDFDNDPLSENLVNVDGQKWTDLRHKLTPTFTSGKLKSMFHLICECSSEFQETLQLLADGREMVEMRELSAKYTTEVIGSCAFGIQMKALKDPNSKFREMGRKIFEHDGMVMIKRNIRSLMPTIYKILRLRTTPLDVENFFMGVVKDVIKHRENTNVVRHDFMQLLIQLKTKGFIDDDKTSGDGNIEFTDNLLAAQAFIFFLAGFETSSTTMSFCLYELAINPDIQNKVREEIDEILAKNDGKMSYEGVKEMKYLNKVVSETLRKHPPAGLLVRKCISPYTVPDSDVTLMDNEQVFIPVFAIHHDPKYYPNPEKFDPERFSEEAIQNRHHYAYLPFGEGPRNCIGLRFAKIQTMVGLVAILSKFCVTIGSKTEIPMRYEPKAFILSTKGIWLHVDHRPTPPANASDKQP